MDSSENSTDLKNLKASNSRLLCIPLSEYAKRLDSAVKARYLEKIECVGIDPVLLKGKIFEQQLFTTRSPYCDFVVCAVGSDQVMLVKQRIIPDQAHWESIVPKLEKFWRVCILPEVLGRWSSRRCSVIPSGDNTQGKVCYCRSDKDEDTVKCCNQQCPVGEFHLSCLGIESTPKTWYCPNCRTLPSCKPAQRRKDMVNRAMKMDSICICNGKPTSTDKILECTIGACTNGTFFHLTCLNFKRMPNNSHSWICSSCSATLRANSQNGISTSQQPPVQSSAATHPTVHQQHTATHPTARQPHTAADSADVIFVKSVVNPSPSPLDKYACQGSMGPYEYGLIQNPSGWLDCVVIQSAQLLLKHINQNIQGFQTPTLGTVRQFDIMTGDFIQILHINGNHWVCMTSIDCPQGYVIVLDSLHSPVSRELKQLAQDLLGPNFKGVRKVRVQQQLNGSDCGIFAIAFATSLAFGQNPVSVSFDIPRMRPHLENCLKSGAMIPFPTTCTS